MSETSFAILIRSCTVERVPLDPPDVWRDGGLSRRGGRKKLVDAVDLQTRKAVSDVIGVARDMLNEDVDVVFRGEQEEFADQVH